MEYYPPTLPLDPDSLPAAHHTAHADGGTAPTPAAPIHPLPGHPTVCGCECGCDPAHPCMPCRCAQQQEQRPPHGHHSACLPEPYPPPVATAPNENYALLVRSSFCGRESELTAVMTYFYHAVRFAECGAALSRTLLDIAICEMHHLDLLSRLLLSLGSDPRFYCALAPNDNPGGWWSALPDTIICYAPDLGAALRADIESERAAIAEYQSAAAYIDDPGISALLLRILRDEQHHLALFEELYRRFCC